MRSGEHALIALPAAPGTNAMGHRRTRELAKASCAAVSCLGAELELCVHGMHTMDHFIAISCCS